MIDNYNKQNEKSIVFMGDKDVDGQNAKAIVVYKIHENRDNEYEVMSNLDDYSSINVTPRDHCIFIPSNTGKTAKYIVSFDTNHAALYDCVSKRIKNLTLQGNGDEQHLKQNGIACLEAENSLVIVYKL